MAPGAPLPPAMKLLKHDGCCVAAADGTAATHRRQQCERHTKARLPLHCSMIYHRKAQDDAGSQTACGGAWAPAATAAAHRRRWGAAPSPALSGALSHRGPPLLQREGGAPWLPQSAPPARPPASPASATAAPAAPAGRLSPSALQSCTIGTGVHRLVAIDAWAWVFP